MNAMLRTLVVAALIVAACASYPPFKVCEKNQQSVTAYTDALIEADVSFDVYSSAYIEAMTYVQAASKALTDAQADGWAAVYAQAGQGKCVDASVSAYAVAIAKALSAVSASMTAVITAEAEAYADAYISLFAYSVAAAESCTCPANSDAIADSFTTASADVYVHVSSEAEKVFKDHVKVRDISKAWSAAFSACTAKSSLCHRRNKFASSVSGGCAIKVTGSGDGVDCSLVTNPETRDRLGC